jgi:hypothetical protein
MQAAALAYSSRGWVCILGKGVVTGGPARHRDREGIIARSLQQLPGGEQFIELRLNLVAQVRRADLGSQTAQGSDDESQLQLRVEELRVRWLSEKDTEPALPDLMFSAFGGIGIDRDDVRFLTVVKTSTSIGSWHGTKGTRDAVDLLRPRTRRMRSLRRSSLPGSRRGRPRSTAQGPVPGVARDSSRAG